MALGKGDERGWNPLILQGIHGFSIPPKEHDFRPRTL